MDNIANGFFKRAEDNTLPLALGSAAAVTYGAGHLMQSHGAQMLAKLQKATKSIGTHSKEFAALLALAAIGIKTQQAWSEKEK